MTDEFKRGTVFRHGKWFEPVKGSDGPSVVFGREKAICRVTAIRYGRVYYGFGADAKKSSYHAAPERLLADGAQIIAPCGDCGEHGHISCVGPDGRCYAKHDGPCPSGAKAAQA